jgi:ferredoxin
MQELDADFIIIGSGPSAYSSLSSIPSHFRVTIIDIEEKPSLETDLYSKEIARRVKSNSNPQLLEGVFSKVFDDNSVIGDFKKYFGDDYSYDAARLGLDYKLDVRASVGLGGFSAVWGSTVLPFSNLDFQRMSPGLRKHFQDGYAKIAKSVTIEGEQLNSEAYPDFSNRMKSFRPSDLSKIFLSGKLVNLIISKLLGSHFIASAVMVGESNESEVESCIECGLCHVGCPFGFIWNSSGSIYGNKSQRVTRIQGTVIRFEEFSTCVLVEYVSNGVIKHIKASSLLLSSGPISTSKLVLQSVPTIQSVLIDDSQTFFKHAISFRKVGSLQIRNTLAELMLSVTSKGSTGLLAQLYSRSHYSDFRAQKELKSLKKLPQGVRNFILSRLVTLLIYLPGDLSNKIEVNRVNNVVNVSEYENSATKIQTFQIWAKLWISMLAKGSCIIPLAGTRLSAGGGNHIGRARLMISESVFPISNGFGQLHGHERVYVVDGSSLPAVPAGPITFSIMANASQIVSKLVERLQSL